ncbi:hypothetical protein Taro_004850 [Colocasia esculenta]|uniref:Uncharacterized protein n=1 Tax=Colocasia esculenta TaxID=4460 RepID=A0A843TSU9_COLES|nr:hypothetical protein [Colocasia esculenta]
MEYFLQGHDYQIWSIVEEDDLLVTNEKAQWTDDDRKKISQNCKVQTFFLQKMCRHTHQWCRHNNTDSKAKCVKMLRLCRHKLRVCRHELQFFRNQSTQVDTLSEQVDTLSEQVDTGPSSQNISSHIWDSVSTLPPGQVDTLREVCNLKWMAATCQPRPIGKLGPRRGARSRASSSPIPADRDVALSERRTKRRNDPAEQPGSSSAPQRAAKRGRASSSGRGNSPPNPRTEIPSDSSENPEESSSSSSESSASQEDIPSESVSAAKLILKPRILDLSDIQLADSFPEIQTYFSFQSWIPFISEFQVCYPRLVREFYKNLTCTEE